ncbi:MAG: NADH-quinone oxidoreductase subunit NuoN [Bdellovibrio sp.]
MIETYLSSLSAYVPELVVCLTMVGLVILEATYDREEHGRSLFNLLGFLGLFIAAVVLLIQKSADPVSIFTGSMTIDRLASVAKFIMILGTMGAMYLSWDSKDISDDQKGEFSILAIGVLVGGMMLASANNMLMLYLGVETLSIISYAMASLKKNDDRSAEAGLKYALYGGVTAGLMLFGMSHIFGVLGTINFSEIGAAVPNLTTAQIAILIPSFLFFFAGIGYKIACVPFHMWSPDVYEGSPLPVTAFFSIVPKVAGIASLIRITQVVFASESALSHSWMAMLSVMAALTMTVGNVSAIGQRSMKRMLAYSSIGHSGILILTALVPGADGQAAFLFYSFVYLFMTLVAFYLISAMNDSYGNDYFERFNGFVFRYPLMAIILSLVMFSLAGIPPLGGFIAKFKIFALIIEKKYYTLALIAGFNSVVSLYYYLKVVRLMVFKQVETQEEIKTLSYVNQLVYFLLALPIIWLGLYWSSLNGLLGV